MAASSNLADEEGYRGTRNSSGAPSSGPMFNSALRTSSLQQDPTELRSENNARTGQHKKQHSVSLAVPYSNTMPSSRPTIGERPLQAQSYHGGVAKHGRTSTSYNDVAPPKTGRRTLHLLNPVHLLMRRRSHVPPTSQEDAAPTKSLTVPPMTLPADYDPRIRGKVVHDFSAPRTKPSASRHDATTDTKRPYESKRNSQHSAAFREHLDDDDSSRHRESAIHAERLANHKFLQRLSQHGQDQSQVGAPQPEHADFQSFRRSIGDWQARIQASTPPDSQAGLSTLQRLEGERGLQDRSSESPKFGSEGRSSNAYSAADNGRYSQSSVEARQRASSATLLSQHSDQAHPSTIPKHVKSNASRFSFQLGGNENAAEERLLEERAKHKRTASSPKQPANHDDEEDYFDEDAMYDVDELEGLDEEDENGIGLGLGHQELPLHQTLDSRQDTNDMHNDHQQSMDKNAGTQRVAKSVPHASRKDPDTKRSDSHQGLQIGLPMPSQLEEKEYGTSRASHDFDDDFYFNDGTIGGGDEVSDGVLDEGDDESVIFGSDVDRKELSEQVASSLVSGHAAHHTGMLDRADSDAKGVRAPPTSHDSMSPEADQVTALHSALAAAANNAAVQGRFSRTTSVSTLESKPGNGFVSGWQEDNYLEDSLDDFAGDDSIISEANAEALASDEEGFYGREFGFYARARPGSSEDEPINGGFFGAPGESNIERKYSIKEPNLTPITERSEFSARNSVIGGGGPWSPAALSSNPAALAAQLARMSPIALAELQEDYSDLDISLEQMLRLRNLAFNGSDRGGGRSGSISSLSSSAAGGQVGPSQRGSWASAGPPFANTTAAAAARAAGGSRMSRSHSDSPEVMGATLATGGGGMRTYSPNSGIMSSVAATESTGSLGSHTNNSSGSRLASLSFSEGLDTPAPAVDATRTPRREKQEGATSENHSPVAPNTAFRIKPRVTTEVDGYGV